MYPRPPVLVLIADDHLVICFRSVVSLKGVCLTVPPPPCHRGSDVRTQPSAVFGGVAAADPPVAGPDPCSVCAIWRRILSTVYRIIVGSVWTVLAVVITTCRSSLRSYGTDWDIRHLAKVQGDYVTSAFINICDNYLIFAYKIIPGNLPDRKH